MLGQFGTTVSYSLGLGLGIGLEVRVGAIFGPTVSYSFCFVRCLL